MDCQSLRWTAIGAAVCLLLALVFCSDLLLNLDGWGRHDWDFFFWTHLAACRSLFEFREWPLWNPWSVGGLPFLGNPQSQIINPWFLTDLILGPVLALKVVIIAHYAICLGGTYWLGRELGMSRLAATYAAGTFAFSTWLALRVYSGHYTYLNFAYTPWIVGLVYRARQSWKVVVPGALLLGLMLLNGTWEVVLTGIAVGILAALWSLQYRSWRPLAAMALMAVVGGGVGAAKVVPVLDLMRVHPRVAELPALMDAEQIKAAVAADPNVKAAAEAQMALEHSKGGMRTVHGSWFEGTRLEFLGILVKSFFGRQQRGLTVYFHQNWGWHEYGAYLGLVGAVLCGAALFVRRDAWPWILAGSVCLAIGAGELSTKGSYALHLVIQHVPILRSMVVLTRFFIPAIFVASILAALTLDALWARLRRWEEQPGRTRLSWLVPVIVGVALVDSFLVGRYTLHGTFDLAPPTVSERLPELRTVDGDSWKTAPLMLSNRAIRNGYEPLKIPIHVHAEGDPDYRGEHYFVADADGRTGTTRLDAWSPNTARVQVDSDGPGLVVLNRNWDSGWRATSPFPVVAHKGLVAAAVPAGRHTIDFSYRSMPVVIGLAVSLASIAGCLLATFVGWLRRPSATDTAPAIEL